MKNLKKAEQIARDRTAVANKLANCLQEAGEHYKKLQNLGLEAYNEIPHPWPGGPASYRLGPSDCDAFIGIEMQRFGLPKGINVSPSMLDQYPGVAKVAKDSADMIRQQAVDEEIAAKAALKALA